MKILVFEEFGGCGVFVVGGFDFLEVVEQVVVGEGGDVGFYFLAESVDGFLVFLGFFF
ncbi:MAG: hypothetical protein Kapaf2KO_11300 [Candidatus Kapaibacteriales bacterium]